MFSLIYGRHISVETLGDVLFCCSIVLIFQKGYHIKSKYLF